jgi:hypothetical protein
MQKLENSSLPTLYLAKTDPWSSHSVICRLLSFYDEGTRVLDIGTASGMLGRMCIGRNYVIYGIEPNPEWARESSPYYKEILPNNLEDTPESFLRDYDVVVCADVLEHMIAPEKELQRLVLLQNSGTHFIISVPNIANIWIRINLLFGKFEYTDRGILDRSHKNFFTRSSFNEMLNLVGLDVVSISVTPIPLNLVHQFFENNIFGRLLFQFLNGVTQALPTLFGYQFVANAVKSQGREQINGT